MIETLFNFLDSDWGMFLFGVLLIGLLLVSVR
jgi:hypothetical protein